MITNFKCASEIEAFQYEQIFAPNVINTLIENTKKVEYPIGFEPPPVYGIKEMVKFLYGCTK
jgi:hypothetical protein